MPELLVTSIILITKVLIVLHIMLICAAYLVYAERKISAWIQERVGPNRVGPYGLLQSFADVIKLVMKEDVVPKAADKRFHRIAPIISIAVSVSIYAIIPFGNYITIGDRDIYMSVAPHINIGVLFVLAMTSVGVYGITLAGWSSNNKYSLLGGLRSAAQMVSYELSMGLALIGVLMIAGTLDPNEIVKQQANMKWNIFFQPLGFILFLVASFAETNRAPFDLPEAEPELVGGYHTEYSGMKFGLFFLAEYAAMFAASALMATLYLGGWQLPIPADMLPFEEGSIILGLIQFGTFFAKTCLFLFFFIWVRWSVPRFRYDQLMNLGWKVMLPLALANIIITAVVMQIMKSF